MLLTVFLTYPWEKQLLQIWGEGALHFVVLC